MKKLFNVGFIIDPVHLLNPKKDSTLSMIQAALSRGWGVWVFEMTKLNASGHQVYAQGLQVTAVDLSKETKQQETGSSGLPQWIKAEPTQIHLNQLNLVLMRKDPPYTGAYHFCTQLLSHLAADGVTVSNHPRSLREFNEKLFILHFPELTPATLISSQLEEIKSFSLKHGPIVIKPLDAMGGSGIFKVKNAKDNLSVIVELLTNHGQEPVMIQQFIPEITEGDKRILMINGEPVPYVLARIPQGDDFRGNLAAGGKGVVQPIQDKELAIAHAVAPTLKNNGIHFAGLDVIGSMLTEINITSPTCIREIETETKLDISGQLMESLYQHCQR